MGHVPHLFIPLPWGEAEIPLADRQVHHLRRVLRVDSGSALTYTDGAGMLGEGVLSEQTVLRGRERLLTRDRPSVTLAVAPPPERDRQRFLVEKLGELGVDRLVWLRARFGEGRPPSRAAGWAISALEQSRGAHLLELSETPTAAEDLDGWVADPDGEPMPTPVGPVTVLVGPAGGWAPAEIAPTARRVHLGERVLRVETAAVVAAVLVLDRLRAGRTSQVG